MLRESIEQGFDSSGTARPVEISLQLEENSRDLALFNLAIDSKLRGFDLVQLKVSDVMQGGRVRSRTQITQRKTQRPVQFEITE